MKKLKFTIQVLTAIAALPVLTMMELNHNSKRAASGHDITQQQTIKSAPSNDLNNIGKNAAAYQKKNFSRQYVK